MIGVMNFSESSHVGWFKAWFNHLHSLEEWPSSIQTPPATEAVVAAWKISSEIFDKFVTLKKPNQRTKQKKTQTTHKPLNMI